MLRAQNPVAEYYKNVNLAELAIADSNFTAASQYYTAAFNVNPDKPFGHDVFNAFHAAMDIHDYPVAEKYMAILLSRGMGKNFIAKKVVKPYKGADLQQVKMMLNKYPNDTLKDDPAIRKIKEMVKWDQNVRMHFSALNNGAYMVDSTYIADSTIAAELLALFKERGVLSPIVLGGDKRVDYSPIALPLYDIIILHNTCAAMGNKPAHIFDSILYKAVHSFDYDARNFAHHLGECPVTPGVRFGAVIVNFPLVINGCYYKNRMYTEYWDAESEQKMNDNRAKVYMEPLDDFRKKIAAANEAENGNAVLRKYHFSTPIRVMDILEESRFKEWMAINGKDAEVKRNITSQKFYTTKPEGFDIGVFGTIRNDSDSHSMSFVIGKTKLSARRWWWKRTVPSGNEYYTERLVYKPWKNRRPALKMGYHAEIVRNESEDLTTEAGRNNYAKFVPGYQLWVEDVGNHWFGSLRNLELIFEDNLLMSVIGNADTGFYRTVTRHIGTPVYKIKYDTVAWEKNKKHVVILKTRTYTWQKGDNKLEIKLADEMNDKGMRHTYATLHMMDVSKYAAYLAKVEEEKKRLQKLYAVKR
jgi:hypothetical protein